MKLDLVFKLGIMVVLGFFVSASSPFSARAEVVDQPLALVYKGIGSCAPIGEISGCSEAVQAVAESAGYKVQFVGPEAPPADLFKNAKLWIQPGGLAKEAQKAMSDELKSAIVEFVKNGGGYVGFCAGGFLATETFGWETQHGPFEAKGLGLLPGKSWYYDSYDNEIVDPYDNKIIPTVWNGSNRFVYWEEGPYFTGATLSNATVVASYLDEKTNAPEADKAMTIRAQFGKGRVYVTGVHPEAPNNWRTPDNLDDQDGLDYSLAVDMMNWATSSPAAQ